MPSLELRVFLVAVCPWVCSPSLALRILATYHYKSQASPQDIKHREHSQPYIFYEARMKHDTVAHIHVIRDVPPEILVETEGFRPCTEPTMTV